MLFVRHTSAGSKGDELTLDLVRADVPIAARSRTVASWQRAHDGWLVAASRRRKGAPTKLRRGRSLMAYGSQRRSIVSVRVEYDDAKIDYCDEACVAAGMTEVEAVTITSSCAQRTHCLPCRILTVTHSLPQPRRQLTHPPPRCGVPCATHTPLPHTPCPHRRQAQLAFETRGHRHARWPSRSSRRMFILKDRHRDGPCHRQGVADGHQPQRVRPSGVLPADCRAMHVGRVSSHA